MTVALNPSETMAEQRPDEIMGNFLIMRDGQPFLVMHAALKYVQGMLSAFAAHEPDRQWSCTPHNT